MKWPKLAVVRPFPECPGPNLPFGEHPSKAHRWSNPTISGVQRCALCNIWRVLEIPGVTMIEAALDIEGAQYELDRTAE